MGAGSLDHAVQAPALPRASWIARALGKEGLLVFVVAVAACVPLFWDLMHGVTQDTWLALLAGQEVTTRGLPSHDAWSVITHGHRWVDQQWLGQLTFSGLFRLGGLRLVMLTCAAAETIALVLAVVAARRRGASSRVTTYLALLAFTSVTAGPRIQTLVLPLFVLLVVLISGDGRAPSPRVLLALPLLGLWANVHGSVILAAALVSIYGLIARRAHQPLIAVLLIAGPWACVFASPYAAALPGYYRQVLVGGDLGQFVVEWQPMRLMLFTVPFFALIALAVYLAGRIRRELTPAETAILVVTGVAALLAIRNAIWFALAAACLLPPLLARVMPERQLIERFNRRLGVFGIAVLVATATAVAAKPDAGRGPYPPAAAAAAAQAARPDGRIFATLTYADWLLWEQPRLRGRIAFDARLELLNTSQLEDLRDASTGRIRLGLLRDYRVFVIGDQETATVAALRDCGFRTAYVDHGIVVLARGHRRLTCAGVRYAP